MSILLAFLLVFLNGFFVAAEFAIVKLRHTQAEELAHTHGWPGRILAHVRGHLDAYLSACQLGITLASLGLGWIGEPAFAHLIEPALHRFGVESQAAVQGIAVAVAFSIISFLHIVLGELAPKSIAIRKVESISLWTATPLFLFYRLMYPAIWLLNGSALLILRALGMNLASEGEDAHSAEELKAVLAASHIHGELDKEEVDIISRTLEFSELTVGDLMRPAVEMVALDITESIEENLARIEKNRFSRYPVCEGDRDNIVGLVHVKDLFAAVQRGEQITDLRPYLRDIQTVHRDTKAFELFNLFRQGHPHFAVVDDDLGTVTGFVTLDHILEALVGQIQDEFRRRHEEWQRLKDGSLVGEGKLSVYSLERELGIEIDAGEVDSVGGLVMWKLERVPQPGDRAAFEHFDIVVREMRGPRIAKVQVIPKAETPEPTA
ncbi:MAG TPA: hemolysin family protein [Gammaproteobacteria bacterium]|nr:hemolysin family protein [Gammaproteobacteria bacterium]